MFEQDPFDDAMRASMRLNDRDEVDVFRRVAPRPWVWALPFAAAAATVAIAWQVCAPVKPASWPIDSNIQAVDGLSAR